MCTLTFLENEEDGVASYILQKSNKRYSTPRTPCKPACLTQDHPAAVTGWTCPEEIQGISVTDELIDKRGRLRLSAILNYFIRGRGPMATTGCDHGALISTRGTTFLKIV